MHTGKTGRDSVSEENEGQRVVLELIHDLKGRNVTCNNLFISYELALKLSIVRFAPIKHFYLLYQKHKFPAFQFFQMISKKVQNCKCIQHTS